MHSSTSNSDARLPGGPWGQIWGVALLICVVLLLGYEAIWRARGFTPLLDDDFYLWASARRRVQGEDTNQVILLGASRIHMGINTKVFAENFGANPPPVQLAVDGGDCRPVLEHFAADRSFRGLIICEIIPGTFYEPMDLPRAPEDDYVAQYEKLSAFQLFETRPRQLLQRSLVSVQASLNPKNLLQRFSGHAGWPQPSYVVTYPDRSKTADFRRADLPAELARREKQARERIRVGNPARFREDLERIKSMVSRIQQRGGRVVFVRLPVSGVVREMDDQLFPRSDYWDVLAQHSGALTIAFEDYPTLANFKCPEGSHLDYRDAKIFTAAFTKLISEKLRLGEPNSNPP